MLGEQQPLIPNLNSVPPSNPNPNQPLTNASHFTNSHGFNGLQSISEITTSQHASGIQASGITVEATQVPTVMHSADNFGMVSQPVANDVILPRQPVNIQPFQCEICNIACDTRDVLEKHKAGKKHSKNMKKIAGSSSIAPEVAPQQPPVVGNKTSVGELENKKHKLLQNGASVDTLICCHICNVVCNNQDVYLSHVAGKRHSAKAAIQLAITNGTFNPESECSSQAQPSNDGTQKKPDTLQLLWCELCKISCTSIELLNLHLAGKKHLKILKRSEQIPNLSLTTEYLEKLQKPVEPDPAPAPEPNPPPAPALSLAPATETAPAPATEPNGKRAGSHEDVKTKKQKVLNGGVSDAASTTCTMCNVVCNSPTDFRAHLAGKKHIVLAVKQAEAQATGQAK